MTRSHELASLFNQAKNRILYASSKEGLDLTSLRKSEQYRKKLGSVVAPRPQPTVVEELPELHAFLQTALEEPTDEKTQQNEAEREEALDDVNDHTEDLSIVSKVIDITDRRRAQLVAEIQELPSGFIPKPRS